MTMKTHNVHLLTYSSQVYVCCGLSATVSVTVMNYIIIIIIMIIAAELSMFEVFCVHCHRHRQ